MFDEKSEKWIRILKVFTQVMFCLYIIAAVVCCICGWASEIDITGEEFLDGIICLAIGVFMAFAQLVINMLVIQYLNNVQIIREKVEKM